ncbi:MAG: KH domain-containing protein [Candidatus Ancillula trichonymphae]|jgi:predicted RNA-binding protein YlqC (UPF0109 family)|nr:KH domain-containing protein [Candidatus Ancillula trichonymphae]
MLKEALLFIMVRTVVRNPGEVNVSSMKETIRGINFYVTVDEEDIGALIGRGGSTTISAIRTVMFAFAQGQQRLC